MNVKLTHRPRRLRNNSHLRDLFTEHKLCHDDFVFPVFVTDNSDTPEEIESMPEIYRWPIKMVSSKIKEWQELGINAFAIFPQINSTLKNLHGDEILNRESLIYRIAEEIKSKNENVILIGDLALDPYTSNGHDGVLGDDGLVDNDITVQILANAATLSAKAGYDLVAPSDMMDGRIKAIRNALDISNFKNIGIISYSAKYSSAYYGPFRNAIGSNQKKLIDKSSYQLNPANFREAKRELHLDFTEGADILMVKPAEMYLDVISYAKQNFDIPIAGYQVSGEYSRLWAAYLQGWLELDACMLESLLAIKRAGADIIFSYFTERIAKLI